MNAQDIINQAINIIKRQDVTGDNRALLLFFINTVRRAVLRDRKIPRFFAYHENVPHNLGVIDMTAQYIKAPHVVEWEYSSTRTKLSEVYSHKDAADIYGDLSTTGNPTGFLRMGASLYILPVPTTGQINIYGEFWPADLTDSVSSSDITTVEIPEVLVYLGAAEYLDMLGETDKAQYWRQKGMTIIDQYVKQFQGQAADTADLWRRWPFGRPLSGRRPATTADLGKGSW